MPDVTPAVEEFYVDIASHVPPVGPRGIAT